MQPSNHSIFFDFGNVVGHFDYLILCERFGKRIGLSADEFRKRLVNRGFAQLLDEFERGLLSAESFAEKVCELGDVEIPYDQFVPEWSDIFRPNESIGQLIVALKSNGYPLYLGSNTNILHATHYRRQFESTLGLLDGFVLSYEVGHIKPSPEFFQACSRLAGVAPENCLFIDDVEENVAGARAVGLNGILYQDTDSLIDALRDRGVVIPNFPD